MAAAPTGGAPAGPWSCSARVSGQRTISLPLLRTSIRESAPACSLLSESAQPGWGRGSTQLAVVPIARALGQACQLANAILLPEGSTTQLQSGLEPSHEAEERRRPLAEVLVQEEAPDTCSLGPCRGSFQGHGRAHLSTWHCWAYVEGRVKAHTYPRCSCSQSH